MFFLSPDFNGNWSGLAARVTHMPEIFKLATRALHGMFGYEGLIYDAIQHLDPVEFIPALHIIAKNYYHVT
jgi:hypothetical protein